MVVESESEIIEQMFLWELAACNTQPEPPLTCVTVSDAADVETLKNTHKTNVDIWRQNTAARNINPDSTLTQKQINHFQNKNI